MEEDLYDQKIERNRCTLIKYIETENILDELRQKQTISVEDYEDVNACTGRRRRAAKLLDILQTKGDSGVKEFFKTIELVYPDLYQEVTGESPRKPPPNYLKRQSRIPSLRYINHLPQLAKELKTQYQNNKHLVQQLQDLENAMVFEQNDNKELEKENSELRKWIDSLKKDRDALESQVANFMTENHKLKDESLNYLKTSLEYHQQSELYKQRAREIQAEKDEMERIHRTRQERQEGERQSRLSFGVSLRSSQTDMSLTSTDLPERSTLEANLMLQQQMLNENLEEMQQELAQTAEELHMSRMETDEYQKLYKNVNETCERLKKERTKMDSLLEKQLSTTNHYFEMIQKLEMDKKMLEEERIKEQKKVSEESEKRNKLFMEKHKLEQNYTTLLTEVERLRTDIKKRNSKDDLVVQDSPDGHISGDRSEEDNEDKPKTQVPVVKRGAVSNTSSSTRVHPGTVRCPQTLENNLNQGLDENVALLLAAGLRGDDDIPCSSRICRQYVNVDMVNEATGEDKSFKSDESFHTSDENSQYLVLDDMLALYIDSVDLEHAPTYTIKIKTPLLKDKFEVIGGNMTGIYVKRVIKKKSSYIQEGDKILSVGVFITDVQALHTDLVYRTFEDATHILQAQADPSHANMVEVKIQRDPEGYARALDWIMRHGSGDLFFIRSNVYLEEDSNCPSIQNGDIFCVSSTMMGNANKYWKGFRFDKGSNSWLKDPVSLPNISEALKLRRGTGTGRQRGRQQAFRHRPYSRVLPTRSFNTDCSTDDAQTHSSPLPWSTKFEGKVHWHKESRLDTMDVERYRHLLGYSSDVSFTNTSIDLDNDTSNICNSISLPNEECYSL